jgi:hypothetical protein
MTTTTATAGSRCGARRRRGCRRRWWPASPSTTSARSASPRGLVTASLDVGHRARVGVHLNRGLDWNEIAGAIEDAYAQIAPKSLVEQARRGS